MAPPGMKKKKPALVVDVAVGKDKGPMKPPGMASDEPEMPETPDMGSGGKKHSVEEAHKVAENEHCSDCVHYQAESGECETVDGYWDPDDACVRFFEAGGASEEPDADDGGGAPDNDADDQDMNA